MLLLLQRNSPLGRRAAAAARPAAAIGGISGTKVPLRVRYHITLLMMRALKRELLTIARRRNSRGNFAD